MTAREAYELYHQSIREFYPVHACAPWQDVSIADRAAWEHVVETLKRKHYDAAYHDGQESMR